MAADLQLTLPSLDAASPRHSMHRFAQTALARATRFWFVVTVLGQLLFAFTVAAYYGLTAVRGDLQAWNRSMSSGHRPGEPLGNTVVAAHLVAAVVIIVAGALQFVPTIRNRFPRFHRWLGRVYMLMAVTLTTAGLYMLWVRGSANDLSQRLGLTLNAVFIWISAARALRHAIRRQFDAHRRWTLRLFLTVSGAWFFRVALFLSFLIFQRPVGFDANTFTGPFLSFLAFAQYLFPLAVLELYFFVQARPGAVRRLAMAASLVVLTLGTGGGVFGIGGAIWWPAIRAAFDDRISIVRTLSATIASNGIDAGIRQYYELKATRSATYNFDENQLNRLGYEFLRTNKVREAIRIFQVNVHAYPQSSNTHDSLAEAHLREGNRSLAIAHYRRAVQLNPKNENAMAALRKLGS